MSWSFFILCCWGCCSGNTRAPWSCAHQNVQILMKKLRLNFRQMKLSERNSITFLGVMPLRKPRFRSKSKIKNAASKCHYLASMNVRGRHSTAPHSDWIMLMYIFLLSDVIWLTVISLRSTDKNRRRFLKNKREPSYILVRLSAVTDAISRCKTLLNCCHLRYQFFVCYLP